MQTLGHSSPGSSRRPGRILETAELIASCAVIAECLLGSVVIGAWLYAAVVPVSDSSKMQSIANDTTVLKGDRLDRTTATRDWTDGPMKMKVVSPDQKLLIGCEPAFSKFAIDRDRREARCLT